MGYVAVIAFFLISVLAVNFANVCRCHSTFTIILLELVTACSPITGPIIAIGVLAMFITCDNWLAPVYSFMGMGDSPLILSLSLIMLIVGYFIRFMATGFNATEVGFEKVGTKYMEASRMLGLGV